METWTFLRSSVDLIAFEADTMLDVVLRSSKISDGERAELTRCVNELRRLAGELTVRLGGDPPKKSRR
jgi:hypothetical protein